MGGAGDDQIDGGAGADSLVGGDGNDLVTSGAGNDRLAGGKGKDRLSAGTGNDRAWVDDSERDRVNCGSGKDRIDTDGLDKLTSCERTGLPAPTPDPDVPGLGPLPDEVAGTVGGVRKITTPGRIVPIPGFPGERIDSRLLPDIRYLKAKYHIFITDGYSLRPIHAHGGEHPLGLAIDIIPGPGGSWDDIDRLAKWAEPRQNHTRAPYRWVGYTGDANHGRGNHLHLSWMHAPARFGHVAQWVMTFDVRRPPGSGQ